MMSASPPGTDMFSGDENIQLVQKLIEKTRERKIHWSKAPGALTSSIQGGMKFTFILPGAFPPSSRKWIMFVVRDGLRTILKIGAGAPTLTALQSLAGISDRLRTAVEELFDLAIKVEEAAVRRVIDKINSI